MILDEHTSASEPKRTAKLDEAAKAWGIEQEYWDIWGKKHRASPAVQKAILSSLGVDAGSSKSIEQALDERLWQVWSRPLPPTLVISQNPSPRAISAAVPAGYALASALLQFRWEDHSTAEMEIDLAALPPSGEVDLRGQRFIRKLIPLPDSLPLGYHELAVRIGSEISSRTRLIVCPDRAYQPSWLKSGGRGAGLAVSLYGLRSSRNWGCGDFTDLKALIDWAAAELGATFIALNPLHAIPNRQPFNTSPYLPNSIFYKNAIYLDLEAIEEFQSSGSVRISDAVRKQIASLRGSEFVEYEQVAHLKTRFLKVLFNRFLDDHHRKNTPREREFQSYLEREGDLLHRFALHSALDEAMRKQNPELWSWRAWPEPYQQPESGATKEFARKHWRSVLFHKYAQWQVDLQLSAAQEHAVQRGLRIGLYHDLALATDRFGCDLWSHRPFYAAGCRVGSPPDGFSPKGQDWAFPPPNSEQHYQDGYRLFSESIRRNARHGGALRIDHVMRFSRLYWIPDGMEALDGTYVRDQQQDLLRILALESVRQKVIVVGEDLGTVPDQLREALQRFGILSYRLLYFEQDKHGRFRGPDEYPGQALASITTHDLPTLAGFWLGRDIEARRNAGLLPDDHAYRKMWDERNHQKQKILDLLSEHKLLPDSFPRDAAVIPELTGELHNAVIGFLASTPCALFLLNQEDLLKEAEQQNLPGSTAEYRNWGRKMKYTLEELQQNRAAHGFAQMFRNWLEKTGRLNPEKQGHSIDNAAGAMNNERE